MTAADWGGQEATSGRLTPQQAAHLADGATRAVEATRRPRRWARLVARLEAAKAVEQARKAVAIGKMAEAKRKQERYAGMEPVRRKLPAWLSLCITLLLMGGSYFTISSVLAISNMDPQHAWLIPLAFGPVLVLGLKVLVGFWLSNATDPGAAARRLVVILGVLLGLGFLGMVVGVAIKSASLGMTKRLDPTLSMWSSAVLFGALIVAEGASAAALAALQYASGAREYEAARTGSRIATKVSEKAVRRALAATRTVRRLAGYIAGWEQWAAGRGELARAWAFNEAIKTASPEDPIVGSVRHGGLDVQAPTPGLLTSKPREATPIPTPMSPATATDIDREFEQLLAGSEGQARLW